MRKWTSRYIAFTVLCIGQLSQASFGHNAGVSLYFSQSPIGFSDVSSTDLAIIVGIALAGLLLLTWVIRRFIRRRKLSNARKQRHGTASLEGIESDSGLLARPRPEKTVVVRSIVIGSEHDVDVRFDSEGVSTHHAELLVLRQIDSSPLMPLEPMYYLRDLASSSGVEVHRGEGWMKFSADVVLNDEQLRIGAVETTAAELDRLAIKTKMALRASDESS